MLIVAGLSLVALTYWVTSSKSSRDAQTKDDSPVSVFAPSATTASAPTIKKGTWRVGQDVQPGTYTTVVPNVGNMYCIWTRLNRMVDFKTFVPKEGEPSVFIDTGTALIGETVTVKILPTDVGFDTQGCGTWTKVD